MKMEAARLRIAPKRQNGAIWRQRRAALWPSIILESCIAMEKARLRIISDSLKFFKLAAEQNFAPAQYSLGIMHENGQGVRRNFAEALKLYNLAAEQVFVKAYNNLGVMYLNGKGVPDSDCSEALRLFQ